MSWYKPCSNMNLVLIPIAKTMLTKLEFRAQSILNFNFHFSRRPLFLFTYRWNLSISRLDKFINFSWSFHTTKITLTYLSVLPIGFYLDHLSLRPSRLTSSLWPSRLLRPSQFTSVGWLNRPLKSVHFGRNLQSKFLSLKT